MHHPSIFYHLFSCTQRHRESQFLVHLKTSDFFLVLPVAHVFCYDGEDVSARQTFNKPNGEEKEPFVLVYLGAAPIFFSPQIASLRPA